MKRSLQYIIPFAVSLLWGATFLFETERGKITWVTLNGAVTALLTLFYQVRRDDREVAAVEAARIKAHDDDVLIELLVHIGTPSQLEIFDREKNQNGLTQKRAENLIIRACLQDRQRFGIDAARNLINALRVRYEWRQSSGLVGR